MNSRAKGKRIELEAVHALTGIGWDCTRSAQHCGKEAADLRTKRPAGIHVEVKGRKALAVQDFMDQAVRDKFASDLPIVLMRENRGDWLVMVRLRDLRELAVAVAEIGRETPQ